MIIRMYSKIYYYDYKFIISIENIIWNENWFIYSLFLDTIFHHVFQRFLSPNFLKPFFQSNFESIRSNKKNKISTEMKVIFEGNKFMKGFFVIKKHSVWQLWMWFEKCEFVSLFHYFFRTFSKNVFLKLSKNFESFS